MHAAGWTAGVCALLFSSLFGHPWLTPFVLVQSLAALGLVAALTAQPARTPVAAWLGADRLVVIAALVVLAVSAPSRITAARAGADLDRRMIGASAVMGELDGVPYLQLCENRPYDCLNAAEIDRLVLEIGGTGDEMERRMSAGGDLL